MNKCPLKRLPGLVSWSLQNLFSLEPEVSSSGGPSGGGGGAERRGQACLDSELVINAQLRSFAVSIMLRASSTWGKALPGPPTPTFPF